MRADVRGTIVIKGVFEIFENIQNLKHLQVYQWVILVGAIASSFGAAMSQGASEQEAIKIAVGAGVVALAHLLQPSPTENKNRKEKEHDIVTKGSDGSVSIDPN